MMFTLWEEWDYLAGCYFCFVTLSTIGFGDLVPGTGQWAILIDDTGNDSQLTTSNAEINTVGSNVRKRCPPQL